LAVLGFRGISAPPRRGSSATRGGSRRFRGGPARFRGTGAANRGVFPCPAPAFGTITALESAPRGVSGRIPLSRALRPLFRLYWNDGDGHGGRPGRQLYAAHRGVGTSAVVAV